jgi:carboxypeptidase Q
MSALRQETNMKKNLALFIFLIALRSFGQSSNETILKTIFDEALKNGKAYDMLEHLTHQIGPRLSGSQGASDAVEWSRHVMTDLNFDSVWLQPVMVPHWVRGQKEIGRILYSKKKIEVHICALGGSVGTGPQGIIGKVIEVKNFKELAELGAGNIQGKIVFFNRPMDPTEINTFNAYGGAVDQRSGGSSEAAKYGAVAVIVRSMGLSPENYPHTGAMNYIPGLTKIPAAAISTQDADVLSDLCKKNKDLQFYLESHCEILEDVPSFNVVGEIKGDEYSDQIILVSGHLDSWDLAEGAHDDGAGCVQAIETLRLLKAIGYKPKRTLRAVLFMNEENGARGGAKYAELSNKNKEAPIAAIESDRGGFTPRGFTMSGSENAKMKIRSWKPLFEPYGLSDFEQEGGGTDIEPLFDQGVFIIGYLPDSQRYFDYHHAPTDTLDKVNRRELELGAASMAALVILLDKYGIQ